MSVQITIMEEIKKIENSLKRESAIKNQIENYKALLDHIGELKEDLKPLPEDITFKDYQEWETYVNKKIKSRNNSMRTVEKNKDIMIALEYYLEQNPEK